MTEPSSSLDFSDIYNEVSEYVNNLRTGQSAAQLVEVKLISNLGYLEFLNFRDWAFLSPWTSITLWATATGTMTVSAAGTCTGVKDNGTTTVTATAASFYASMVGEDIVITDTGTFTISGYTSSTIIAVTGDATCSAKAFAIAGAGDTVTAAAATFYPSMIGHKIVADTSETEHTISAYTSSTVVTVSADASADTGDTFTITADGHYTLPDNFRDFKTASAYQVGGDADGHLYRRSPAFIRNLHSGAAITGNPSFFALQHLDFVVTTGQRKEMYVWMIPSADRTLDYQHSINVTAMTADAEYPIGGPEHCTTVLAAALAKAEEKKGEVAGEKAKAYERLLAASIRTDNEHNRGNIGYNRNVQVPVGIGRQQLDTSAM